MKYMVEVTSREEGLVATCYQLSNSIDTRLAYLVEREALDYVNEHGGINLPCKVEVEIWFRAELKNEGS